MRWTGHVACTKREIYQRNCRKNYSIHHSTDLDGDARMILKWNLEKHGECMTWTNLAKNGVTTIHPVPPPTFSDY